MPSLLSGIQMAFQAMMAHQQAIEIVQHNVANAGTPGYRRQAAVMTAAYPVAIAGIDHGLGAGLQGTGVQVETIKRFTIDFFDTRYRQSLADNQQWAAQKEVLQQVESTLSETSTSGLLSLLDGFWSNWRSIASEPQETAYRQDVIGRAETLAGAFRSRAVQLGQLRTDQNQAIIQTGEEVNSLAAKVAQLNGEISRILSIGEQPNDLLDERDRALDRLSELAGAVSSLQPNGEVLVSIGSHIMVIGKEYNQLKPAADPDDGSLVKLRWNDGQYLTPTNGKLFGLVNARQQISDQLDGLNQLAAGMIQAVNAAHMSGFDLDGENGLAFFTGTDAADIQFNSAIDDPRMIAAANAGNSPGDGSNAHDLAMLQSSTLMAAGSLTFHNFYDGQVSKLALMVNRAGAQQKAGELVVQSLEKQRESLTGVSLDEEAANLLKSQRAFEAAARVMTTMDQMLDRIINGMGVVGR